MTPIQQKLLEFKIPIVIAAAAVVAVFSLLRHGPSLATVVNFFWPLLLSTGFFLAAVALLLRISPPPSDSASGVAGEELIDYVAGRAEDDRGVGRAVGDGEEEGQHQKSL